MRRCASLLLQDDRGAVLFVRQTYGARLWGFPGGIVDAGESPRDAALRETMEEVGIEAAVCDQIGEYVLTGRGWPDIQASVFVGRVVAGEPQIGDPDEIEEIRWVDPTAPPSGLLPDAEAGLTDFLAGLTGVKRRHERNVALPEWTEPDLSSD